MTCAHCEELEERVAWLESEIGIRNDAEVADLIYAALSERTRHLRGTSVGRPQAARMIAALYAVKGRAISRWMLLEAVPSPSHKEDRGDNLVSVWVTRARQGLGKDAIANVWGHGYRLTDTGMAAVAEILRATPAKRVAA